MGRFKFKNYAWSIGTTSLRMADINRKIEEELLLLDEFWKQPSISALPWDDYTEAKFYDLMYEREFITGNIAGDQDKKAKTARQKTSGLVDLGLIDDSRRLTENGDRLVQIVQNQEYKNNSPEFNIPVDSLIYFKQLLKMSVGGVRPYMVLVKALHECDGSITEEEFEFLLPLAVSEEKAAQVISGLQRIRRGEATIDGVIEEIVLSGSNYVEAWEYLRDNEPTEDIIKDVGINRKSPTYDKAYFPLYNALHDIFMEGKWTDTATERLNQTLADITPGIWWKRLLFKSITGKKRVNNLAQNDFWNLKDETEFKRVFFRYMHLFKAKSLLYDYFDLNRRYIKMSDSVIFEDGQVRLSPVFQYYFETEAYQAVGEECFSDFGDGFDKNLPLEAIDSRLRFDERAILRQFNADTGENYRDIRNLYDYFDTKRYERFDALVGRVFTSHSLTNLFGWFRDRKDAEIKNLFKAAGTDCEDVPTLYEYTTGIAWYKLSGCHGDILKYMNLSLDTNLLPKYHAGGFDPDIVYQYDETEEYPAHTLLIECTLMNSGTQRRGEMEPVTRHLGTHIINEDPDTYCVFATNNLAQSILSDFRARNGKWTYLDTSDTPIKSMNIVPLDSDDFINIINNHFTYGKLYGLFMKAYADHAEDPKEWRQRMVVEPLGEMQPSDLDNISLVDTLNDGRMVAEDRPDRK